MKKLFVKNLGPIKNARVELGDLSLFVGPQATGKSILLQLLKLLVDSGPIRRKLKSFNLDWHGKLNNFLQLYFGDGMSNIYANNTAIEANGKPVELERHIKAGGPSKGEEIFFIPAQRVISLRDGQTRPFTDYRAGDPFVVREFSEQLHQLVQLEFAQSQELFPQKKRLKAEYRKLLSEHIFGKFSLRIDTQQLQKRMVLSNMKEEMELPFLVWSAGQREFMPLLLGLYWLMPPTKVAKRDSLSWVVIEELEMGLHPEAISVVMLLVLELLYRGYKVCLSTHSPHVLDVVWAIQEMKRHKGEAADVLKLFGLSPSQPIKDLASRVLDKEYRVFFFKRDGRVENISTLDPGAESSAVSGWGGLTEFSGRVSEIVGGVVSRAEQQIKTPRAANK